MTAVPEPGDLDDLAARFAARNIPRAAWTHLAHLMVGAWHVDRYGAKIALERLRVGIRALNESNGVANTATAGYHETVTAAYVQLIAAFSSACGPTWTLEDRARHLIRSRFADKDLLLRFWSRDVLMSPAARAAWLPPDRAPLALPPDLHPGSGS